jgi:hypothetical protein
MEILDQYLATKTVAPLFTHYKERFEKRFPKEAKKRFSKDRLVVSTDQIDTNVRMYLEKNDITPLQALILGTLMEGTEAAENTAKDGDNGLLLKAISLAIGTEEMSFRQQVAASIRLYAEEELGEKTAIAVMDTIIKDIAPHLGKLGRAPGE